MVAEGGEGENPLTAPKRGRGGVSRLRFPPDPHLRSSRFSRQPRLRQAPTRRFAKNRHLREKAPSLLASRAPSPDGSGPRAFWRPGPQAPCGLDRHSHRLTLSCYHNPQSADFGGRWMVCEGGALQSHERRGSRRWAGPQGFGPGQQALHPGSLAASRIPKMPRCSSKSLACCTD